METAVESPVLTLREAAAYVRRTPRAMYNMRNRRTGPASFRAEGRVVYRLDALNRWLADQEARDSRSNPALDPTKQAPEPRRAKRRPQQLAA